MALVLDAGALIAIDRGDVQVIARVARAHHRLEPVITSAAAVAQVIRDRSRQVTLERALSNMEERPIDSGTARAIGRLLASSRTADVVDAAVAVAARSGDELMTSDPSDLRTLLAGQGVTITTV